MPFCTSCGKESPPGKKFCEYCGAPLEPPAAPVMPAAAPAAPVSSPVALAATIPPAPVLRTVAPGKTGGGSGKGPLVAGFVIILILVAGAYFIGLPMLGGPKDAGTGIPATTATTHLPTVTLTGTQPAITLNTQITGTPGTIQTYEDRYMESYNQVYSINQPFSGGQKEVFPQDLTNPPLYIKFNITPKMYIGEKRVDIGMPSERIVNTSYPSPNAWFKVNVYDAGNNALVEDQGFNKEHSVTTKQEFMVRAPGNYRVEMSGNDVTAEVRILTGK
jgi:hypothetical protein